MSIVHTCRTGLHILSNVRIISKSPSRNSLSTLNRTPFSVSSAWGEDWEKKSYLWRECAGRES